jgi:heme-degrading monooxygenase HmoA
MFASVLDIQFQAGKMDEVIEIVSSLRPDLEQVDGLKQFITINRGNDRGLAIVIYESQAHQESAGPKSQEILGRLAPLMAGPPNREGCEVVVNEVF